MKEQRFIMLATIDFSLCGQFEIPLRLPSHTAELLLDAAFLCNVVHTKKLYIFYSSYIAQQCIDLQSDLFRFDEI